MFPRAGTNGALDSRYTGWEQKGIDLALPTTPGSVINMQ